MDTENIGLYTNGCSVIQWHNMRIPAQFILHIRLNLLYSASLEILD
jgi:hypothetical protein